MPVIVDKHLVDQVVCLRGKHNTPEYYAIVAGCTFGPWRDAGAAEAGKQTEQRRYEARKEMTHA